MRCVCVCVCVSIFMSVYNSCFIQRGLKLIYEVMSIYQTNDYTLLQIKEKRLSIWVFPTCLVFWCIFYSFVFFFLVCFCGVFCFALRFCFVLFCFVLFFGCFFFFLKKTYPIFPSLITFQSSPQTQHLQLINRLIHQKAPPHQTMCGHLIQTM